MEFLSGEVIVMKMFQMTDSHNRSIDSDEVDSTSKVEKSSSAKWLNNLDDWDKEDFLTDANSC